MTEHVPFSWQVFHNKLLGEIATSHFPVSEKEVKFKMRIPGPVFKLSVNVVLGTWVSVPAPRWVARCMLLALPHPSTLAAAVSAAGVHFLEGFIGSNNLH